MLDPPTIKKKSIRSLALILECSFNAILEEYTTRQHRDGFLKGDYPCYIVTSYFWIQFTEM